MYVSFVHTCSHVADVSWWFIILFLYCLFSLSCFKHGKGDTAVGVSLCFSPGVVLWQCGTSQAGYRRQWSHHIALWRRLATRCCQWSHHVALWRCLAARCCQWSHHVALWRCLAARCCQWSHHVALWRCLAARCCQWSHHVALWRCLAARCCQWSHYDVISLHNVVSGRIMTSSRCTPLSVVALWRLAARCYQWSHDDVISMHAAVSGRMMTSSRCTLLSRRIMTPRSVSVLRDRIVVTGNIMNSHRGQCYPGFQKEKWYQNISS